MRGTTGFRLAVLVTAIVLVTACRAISTECGIVVRFLSAAVVQPFVEAQACAALTQSSFKKAPVVPAKPPVQTVQAAAPVKAEVIEALPAQRFIRAKLAPAPTGGRCGCVKKPIVVLFTAS
jgi:hypothetical protein